MLVTSVHIATSVATLLLLSAAAHAQAPKTNTWGGCAMCPAEPPTCEPGCAKCVVTLGSCNECASARCAPANEDDGTQGPLAANPIEADLPAAVRIGTEGGGPGGVVESSEKQSSAARWHVTKVSSLGALVVAGVFVVA